MLSDVPVTVTEAHPGPSCPCEACQKVWKLLGVMGEGGYAYIVLSGIGLCKRCGFREDLRMGACFRCSDFVKGKDQGDGIHELWDQDNPLNRWFVMEAVQQAQKENK